MKSPSHTPGPWIVDIAAFSCYRSISTAARPPYEKIAEIPWAEPSVFDAERNANARLIAAAPELLAVASEFMRLYRAGVRPQILIGSHREEIDYCALVNACESAIAKSKGEVAS